MSKNKTAIAISLFLMFAMVTSLIALPSVNAHDPPWTIETYAYISVEPDPVGVGQNAFVNFWIDKVPPTAAGAYGDRFHGFTVIITDPDGSQTSLGPYTSDDTGGAHTQFTPNKVGTYHIEFNFAGDTMEGANPGPSGSYQADFIGDYYEPSSASTTLAVIDEQVETFPRTPIPTDYWQRPIYSENLDWYKISGNWLGLANVGFTRITGQYNASGNFNPYTTAPKTGHILWTKPLSPGGIIGGEFGGTQSSSSYMQTPQYEPRFGAIIINGVLYYQELPASSTNPSGWVAVDMRTGQEVWRKDTKEVLICGQVLSYVSPNQFGGLAYLWSRLTGSQVEAPNTGTTYKMYSAMRGDYILSIVNGTNFSEIIEGDDGTLLGYYTNSTDHTLNMWNSTRCIIRGTGSGDLNSWSWRPPQDKEIPFSYGIQMSAPIETTYQGEPISPNLSYRTMSSDIVLLHSTPVSRFGVGYDLWVAYDAHTGEKLWGPLNHTELPFARMKYSPAQNGLIFEFTHPVMTWSAYSMKTGQKVWGPSEPYPNPWGYFVAYDPFSAYGMMYIADFGGYVHAYNQTTGEIEWDFFTGSSGYETPYSNWPLLHIEAIADGVVFVAGGHTYSPPLYLGAKLHALNATTGEEIWSISQFVDSNGASAAIADGILLKPNGYDNQLYAYGKGRSATTITAPDTPQTLGTSILVKGTVTDQSPGQTCLGIPAAGTPAIADDSMSAWMEYLYMQQPKPQNATGVEVTISVVDPNGNFYDVSTATSDTAGFYSTIFTPEVPGKYTVIATFEGSESYYVSSAETAISVEKASATAEPTPMPASTADIYILPGIIGIIIAIVVVGAVLILMLRKR